MLPLIATFGTALPRGLKVQGSIDAHRPKGRFWYLHYVGVRPDHQGKGHGGRIIRAQTAVALSLIHICVDPRVLLTAKSIAEQRAIFDAKFAPFFDRSFIRWVTAQRSSLFGLGIPPAQYDALAGGKPMADVLRARLEKLACDFPLAHNYFAWQAFGRGYAKDDAAPLPPYLQRHHYDAVKARAGRVQMLHANMTDMLAASDAASFDRYIFPVSYTHLDVYKRQCQCCAIPSPNAG